MTRDEAVGAVERALRAKGWTADEVRAAVESAADRIVAVDGGVELRTVNGVPYSVPAGADPVPFLANDLAREAVEAGAVPNPFSRIREQTKAEVERRRNGDGLTLEQRLGMDPRPDAAQDELARRLGMR